MTLKHLTLKLNDKLHRENTITSVNRVKLPGALIDGGLNFDYQWIKSVKKLVKGYTLYLGYVNLSIEINEKCLQKHL